MNGTIVELDPVTSNTISHTKSKEIRITSLAPEAAVCSQPEKLIILGEHFPQQGDVWVKFTIGSWERIVKPDFEHHNCALQVTTPVLDVEMNQKTKAEVRLVRISNNTSTEPLDFFFLPTQWKDCQFGPMFGDPQTLLARGQQRQEPEEIVFEPDDSGYDIRNIVFDEAVDRHLEMNPGAIEIISIDHQHLNFPSTQTTENEMDQSLGIFS